MTDYKKSLYLNTNGPFQGPEQAIVDFVVKTIASYQAENSPIQSIKALTEVLTKEIANKASQFHSSNGIPLTGNSKGAGGEWMFDVIWYATTTIDHQNYTAEFVMACESELSDTTIGGIQIDFDKLLLVNCPYRIFICRAEQHDDSPANVNNRIAYFDHAVATCQNLRPNDRVLVLIWDDWSTGKVFPHLIVKS